MKQTLSALFATLYLLGLTACGVTPSTPNTGPGKKYGSISGVTCPNGNSDTDPLCDDYERSASSLGPHCIGTDDCDNNDKKDEEELDENNEPHKNHAVGYFLLGALTLGVLEAVYHPINNTVDWIKNKGDTDVTTPNGEVATVKNNRVVSTRSITKFEKVSGHPYLKYFREVTFDRPIEVTYNGNTAELSKVGLVCIVSKLSVSKIQGTQAEVQLSISNGDRATVASDYASFENQCLNTISATGTYLSFEKMPDNADMALIQKRLGGEMGFDLSTNGDFRKDNYLQFSGLTASTTVALSFLDKLGGVASSTHPIVSAPSDLLDGCSNDDCKIKKILQKNSDYNKSVMFVKETTN